MNMAELNDQTNVNSDVVERLLTNQPAEPGMMSNQELEDLGTHVNGAVDLQITRHTKRPVIIEPGDAPGIVHDENNRK
jgi:hypothetical protein